MAETDLHWNTAGTMLQSDNKFSVIPVYLIQFFFTLKKIKITSALLLYICQNWASLKKKKKRFRKYQYLSQPTLDSYPHNEALNEQVPQTGHIFPPVKDIFKIKELSHII